MLDAYGHVSVRSATNPNHYYLSRAISAGMVTADDIIEDDLDSNQVGGSKGDGYSSASFTAKSTRRAGRHGGDPCAFDGDDRVWRGGVPLRNMIHTGSFINDGVPVCDARKFGGTADDMLIRNPALGKALAGALGTKTAVILFGHGVAITATPSPPR